MTSVSRKKPGDSRNKLLLTAGQIAAIIEGPDGDISRTVTRVRHWGRERLLSPVGPKHPGTGKHLRYPPAAVLDAAVLTALANEGKNVVSGEVPHVLAVARDAFQEWQAAGRQGRHYVQICSFPVDASALPAAPTVAHHKDSIRYEPAAVTSMVVNLTVIFEKLPPSVIGDAAEPPGDAS